MQPVEILVQLAQSGQIDPWNIDIVTVANEYLLIVEKQPELTQKNNLKETGKILFYLAVLLRMKSDSLAGRAWLAEEVPPEPDFELEEVPEDFLSALKATTGNNRQALHITSLEGALQRRTSSKQPRKRSVTLDELIEELKRIEQLEAEWLQQEKAKRHEKRRQVADYSNFTADDIEAMAHEEFEEDHVELLGRYLSQYLVNEFPRCMFSQLVQLRSNLNDTQHPIMHFLALLFLEIKGEVSLSPADTLENFYTDFSIQPGKLETEADWYSNPHRQSDNTEEASVSADGTGEHTHHTLEEDQKTA